MNLAREARCLLRAGRHAVLSTLSQALPGYPYGSIVPYILDADAYPVVLVSRLAEHTRNISVDPRVSLFVLGTDADVQATGRVTYLGRARPIEHPEAVERRYLRFFPGARGYRTDLDFGFFRIEPVSLRVIAGFAQAHWVSREAYAPPPSELAAHEESIIARLNIECADALRLLAPWSGIGRPEIELIGLDCDGLDLRVNATHRRIAFEHCVPSADEARSAIARMADAARNP
jgi:putative heme iron utilization protein